MGSVSAIVTGVVLTDDQIIPPDPGDNLALSGTSDEPLTSALNIQLTPELQYSKNTKNLFQTSNKNKYPVTHFNKKFLVIQKHVLSQSKLFKI